MKLTILITLCFISLTVYSKNGHDTTLTTIDSNSFYSISADTNKKVLIFLHGGVNNPYFDQKTENITLDYLIEGNHAFFKQALSNGFNVIIPITNDHFDWLNQPDQAFTILKKMLGQSIYSNYEELYISGFSDGGTGSFKIFYKNPNYFNGLIVFNGYPQHSNFNQSIDYTQVKNKKVLFLGTFKDKVIPYEFLLTEYCKQKEANANTFFYLTEGNHSFISYSANDFVNVFEVLTDKNINKKTEPVQGFIKNDQLIARYPFRKKIVRKYNFGEKTYKANIEQHKKR